MISAISRYLFPLILKTVHFSTTSALAKVFLTSARFCQSALFVMRNQASSAGSSSGCRSAACFSFLRLITCIEHWYFAICEDCSSQIAKCQAEQISCCRKTSPWAAWAHIPDVLCCCEPKKLRRQSGRERCPSGNVTRQRFFLTLDPDRHKKAALSIQGCSVYRADQRQSVSHRGCKTT